MGCGPSTAAAAAPILDDPSTIGADDEAAESNRPKTSRSDTQDDDNSTGSDSRNATPSAIELQDTTIKADEMLTTPRGATSLVAAWWGDARSAQQEDLVLQPLETPVSPSPQTPAADAAPDASQVIAGLGGIMVVVSAMSAHPENAGVCEQGCSALRNLAFDSVANRIQIVDHGGSKAVLAAMTKHREVASVQSNGCGAIHNLAGGRVSARAGLHHDDPEAAANNPVPLAIAHEGGIPAVVAALMKHGKDEIVQEQGCNALDALSYGVTSNQGAIAEEKGVAQIIVAMDAHRQSEAVQVAACGALRSLAEHAANREAMLKGGAVLLLVGAMGAYSEVPLLQEHACGALWCVAATREAQEEVAGKGGIPAVIAAATTHSSNAAVLEQACGALMALSVGHSQNKLAISDLDGVKVILKALQAHPHHIRLQETACAALAALSEGHAVVQQTFMVEQGAETMLPLMKRHHGHPGVQEQACAVLSNMASTPDHQLALLGTDAVTVLTDSANIHAGRAAVVAHAMAALWHLATPAKGRSMLLAIPDEAGRLSPMTRAVEILKTHAVDPLVQEHSLSLLRNLAVDKPGQKAVMQAAGTVLDSLVLHPKVAVVQEQGLGTMRALACSNPSICEMLTEGDAVAVFLEAMKHHTEECGVQQRGSGALSAIMAGSADHLRAVQIVSKGGAVPIILDAMARHAADPLMQRHGCNSLMHLAGETDELRKSINDTKGVQTILGALTAHLEVHDVQAEGFAALAQMCKLDEARTVLVDSAGIKTVMAGMEAHVSSSVVGTNGCSVVRQLAMGGGPLSKEQVALGEAGVLTAVLGALQAHTDKPTLLAEANAALRELVVGNAEQQRVAHKQSTTEAVLQAMRGHAGEVTVQQEGAAALWALADSCPENQDAACAADGVLPVLQAMGKHPHAAVLQMQCCGALWALSNDCMSNRITAHQSKAVATLYSTMRTHPNEEHVQEQGLRAVSALGHGDTGYLRTVANEAPGGVVVAVAALQAHAASAAVQEKGCTVVALLSTLPTAKAEILKEGGVALVLAAMKAHPESGPVAEAACVAVTNLSQPEDHWDAVQDAVQVIGKLKLNVEDKTPKSTGNQPVAAKTEKSRPPTRPPTATATAWKAAKAS